MTTFTELDQSYRSNLTSSAGSGQRAVKLQVDQRRRFVWLSRIYYKGLSRICYKIVSKAIKFLSLHHREAVFFFLQKEIRSQLTVQLKGQRAIKSGLFRGTRYDNDMIHPNNFNLVHMLGIYETNIQSVLREHVGLFNRFIEIGCGMGFYTVGIARNLGVRAVGFDIDRAQVEIARHFAEINGVTSLVQHVTVTPKMNFGDQLKAGDFCLVDIDGAEIDLFERLDPVHFKQTAFLIECHAVGESSAHETQVMMAIKFGSSHVIKTFSEAHEVEYGELDQHGLTRNEIVFFAREQRRNLQCYILALPRPSDTHQAGRYTGSYPAQCTN
jgi:SAM-dependent methyltransferase